MIKKTLLLTLIISLQFYRIFAQDAPPSESPPEANEITEAQPTGENTNEATASSSDSPGSGETPLGVDPTSPDSDINAPIPEPDPANTENPDGSQTAGTDKPPPPVSEVDFDLLWNCAKAPNMNQQKCDSARYFFCTGRCTRLNCAILTNRQICVDVCGTSHPMMKGCIEAGKRTPAVAALARSNMPMMGYPPPGYNPMMAGGMPNPGMAGAAMMGGVAASAIGSLFGKK